MRLQLTDDNIKNSLQLSISKLIPNMKVLEMEKGKKRYKVSVRKLILILYYIKSNCIKKLLEINFNFLLNSKCFLTFISGNIFQK